MLLDFLLQATSEVAVEAATRKSRFVRRFLAGAGLVLLAVILVYAGRPA